MVVENVIRVASTNFGLESQGKRVRPVYFGNSSSITLQVPKSSAVGQCLRTGLVLKDECRKIDCEHWLTYWQRATTG